MTEEEYMNWKYYTELPYICCVNCALLGKECEPEMAMFPSEGQCEDFK